MLPKKALASACVASANTGGTILEGVGTDGFAFLEDKDAHTLCVFSFGGMCIG